MKKILVAGIGNIFHGDDAFGCEVIRQWPDGKISKEVALTDFGIRSYDLAYALTEPYEAIILIDAVSRGGEAGALYLIEPETGVTGEFGPGAIDAHSMDVCSVIRMTQSLGGISAKLRLVGCEPAVLDDEGGSMSLSEKVQDAIEPAQAMIQSLIEELLEPKQKLAASLEAA